MNEYIVLVELYWQGNTEVLEEAFVPMLLFPPQIPLLARGWSQLSSVIGRRLIVWRKARPVRFWVLKFYIGLAFLCVSFNTVLRKIQDCLVLTFTALLVYFNSISSRYCVPTCIIECFSRFLFVIPPRVYLHYLVGTTEPKKRSVLIPGMPLLHQN